MHTSIRPFVFGIRRQNDTGSSMAPCSSPSSHTTENATSSRPRRFTPRRSKRSSEPIPTNGCGYTVAGRRARRAKRKFMAEATENIPEPKICRSCGESFGCGAKLDGCWCTEIELPEKIADYLKTKYQDGLCPECLSRL